MLFEIASHFAPSLRWGFRSPSPAASPAFALEETDEPAHHHRNHRDLGHDESSLKPCFPALTWEASTVAGRPALVITEVDPEEFEDA